MRTYTLPVVLAMFLMYAGCGRITLVENRQSSYAVVLQPQANGTDSLAAAELVRYLERATGAALPIIPVDEAAGDSLIWIGASGRSGAFPAAVDWTVLAEDGFSIRTRGPGLSIAGGTDMGTLYGVYTFLEEYLGCRRYTPEVEVVPSKQVFSIPRIERTDIPRITFRETHYHTAFDSAYHVWHKLDRHNDEWGMWVHTFDDLVPPEVHFDSHPEYFSEINGLRIPDGQLCLTNEDVFRIVVDSLRAMIGRRPDAKYWSVSQNDTYSPCQCETCRALDEAEGGHAGSLIHFVNRVAAEFPDKVISTLAYQYTRSAPLHVKPASNVNIMLCSIECNRSRPLASDPSSASFVKDVRDWGRLTGNILLWDYVVQFRNLVSPFPNLHVLQPNIQFFVKNNVTALFQQGSGGNIGEFSRLRSYLIATLLWNPDIDVDAVMDDFLGGYYGAAGPHIRRYIDHMHRALRRSGEGLGIYGYPLPSENGYLSRKNIGAYRAIFEAAEAAVAHDPALIARVREARLPLQFARLEQAKVYGTADGGFFAQNAAGDWIARPEMTALLDTFTVRCRRAGIERLWEHGNPPDEYHTVMSRYLSTSMEKHLALFKPVSLTVPASTTYHNGDKTALTNGLKGVDDYHMNWLGFEGDSMEAVIDLESVQPVAEVSVDFLQDVMSWVWMPRTVRYSVSEDGESWRLLGEVRNRVDEKASGAIIQTFSVKTDPVPARYVKVTAENRGICPRWHKGAGGKAWIFADEIIVRGGGSPLP
ncbi:DUF4838 domain-containing protein [bacterium]|nr:DUF4838 domain-containing protein [bacterium]